MPVTTNSFPDQPRDTSRWVGNDESIEFRAPVQGERLDDEDVVAAECAPPDYDEGTEPHGGRLDSLRTEDHGG